VVTSEEPERSAILHITFRAGFRNRFLFDEASGAFKESSSPHDDAVMRFVGDFSRSVPILVRGFP
jgi:hypothetical protein